ncbi:MAG: serine hydroxymethyltransferase [Anaerolineae bacterium]|nr:serine hydroxymethyltransferase [Anaerolineae bacterium]
MTPKDFLFRGELAELDPDVADLVRHETARQARTLIMIPSESTIPEAVREAVGSAFQNIYAEGYPTEDTRRLSQQAILDYSRRLPEYRRNADARYYKGTEYANIIEALARRRAAEVFANERVSADQLFVNVQPLSGAPANNAVYTALLKPGDTILSMNLMFGGHLSHGAPVNRTGKTYKIVPYSIHPQTENLDYDRMQALALEHKPKIIIGGYSSFPLAPDWAAYRRIADSVGAILLADVAHFAGLIIAGAYPSPVGLADIITFTTHKTLQGPRGAIILTHHADLAAKLDRGVFPGEQGGPHMNAIAGLAVALRFATTDQFRQLQHATVANARRLAHILQQRGLRIPHGGTDSHVLVVDCKSVVSAEGIPLSGDLAARILELVGVVCNRQTIPGDTSALRPSGIRLGTPWITQRGCTLAHIDRLGNVIADVLLACRPCRYTDKTEPFARIPFDTLQTARRAIQDIIGSIGIDTAVAADAYPHHYADETIPDGWQMLTLTGDKVRPFLHAALTSAVNALQPGHSQPTALLETDGRVMATGVLEMVSSSEYRLSVRQQAARVADWLRALSDGYVLCDEADVHVRLPGPVAVVYSGAARPHTLPDAPVYADKSYFIGMSGPHFAGAQPVARPRFTWQDSENGLLTTPLHALHQRLGAKLAPFAGYEMPLWYDRVLSEHQAVRTGAGIFDVTHMGVWDVRGAGAEAFLNVLTTNNVTGLKPGRSHYTFLLDVDGQPLDDLLIYRLAADHFFLVVNASNDAKNQAWVQAVLAGEVMIDPARPWRRAEGADSLVLRDLRAASSGDDRRVDIALQGPASSALLHKLGGSAEDLAQIDQLAWAGITRVTLGGYDLLVSRTGYTGERVAYELFPHPDHAAALFERLVSLGAVPCGLAARDSLRIEAGLPLYGHELAGDLHLTPADAGMKSYVRLEKPFFIGKAAFSAREATRDAGIARFRLAKGSRPAHPGDPIIDERGRVIGLVTSCSVDVEGNPTGLAYLKNSFSKKETQLGIFAGSAKARREVAGLSLGDKIALPETLTILSRFPEK